MKMFGLNFNTGACKGKIGAAYKEVRDWTAGLLVVVRKNLAIRRNRWIMLTLELIIPLVIISVVVRFSAKKSVFRSRNLEQMNAFIAKNANRTSKEKFYEIGREFPSGFIDSYAPCGKEFVKARGNATPCFLGYVADDETERAIFKNSHFLVEFKNSGSDVFVRFESESALEGCIAAPHNCTVFKQHVMFSNYRSDAERRHILADFQGAVVFEKGVLDKEVKYKIRLLERYYGSLGSTITTGHINPNLFDKSDYTEYYLTATGFLGLQVLVDKFLILRIKYLTNNHFIHFQNPNCACHLKLHEMPHRGTDQLHNEEIDKHDSGSTRSKVEGRQLTNQNPSTTLSPETTPPSQSTPLQPEEPEPEEPLELTSTEESAIDQGFGEDGFTGGNEIDHSRVVNFSVSVTIVLVLSCSFLILSEQRRIVTEKEEGLTIMLLITGMTYRTQWIGNLIACVSVYTVPVTIMSILATHSFNPKEGALFEMANVYVIWLYLFLYVNALSAICYTLSVFFDQAILAIPFATNTLVIIYLALVYHFDLYYDIFPFSVKLLICLYPSFAFQTALKILSRFENQGVRTYISTLNTEIPHDHMRLSYVMLMLVFDTVFYMALTIYLDRVVKSKLGVFKPWYYIFQAQEWASVKEQAQVAPDWRESVTKSRLAAMSSATHNVPVTESDKSIDNSTSATTTVHKSQSKKSHVATELTDEERSGFQAYPENAEPTIITENLCKSYGDVKAVDNVNMAFFKGEIFVLLGHNGAGKSSLLNIFAGFAEPTSGTATVCGLDIRYNMVQIQEFTGMCMQTNALYEDLTALEQLLIFGRLRGLRNKDALDESLEIMEKLHILEERNTVIRNLSEGDKRKLSLSIALIGDPRIVILDEPTGGMDYYSRRAVWNLLLKIRTSHTVIMSTNFMDEAELLGDRIGIMANGKMHVCGTAGFLRRHLGLGYSLRLKMDAEKTPDQTTKNILFSVVLKSMPNATMSQYYTSPNAHRLLAFDIPLQDYSSENMSALFEDLTEIREQMGIRGFFVSPALMDEVFMALAVKLNPDVQNVKQLNTEPDEDGNNQVSFVHETTKHLTLPLIRTWILIVKKMKYAFRQKVLTSFQILFPIAIVWSGIIRFTSPLTMDGRLGPPLEFTLNSYPGAVTIYHPEPRFDESLLKAVIGPSAKYSESSDINRMLIAESNPVSLRVMDIIAVQIEQSSGKGEVGNVSVYFSTYKPHTSPLAVNIYTNILVKKMDLQRKITTSSHPLRSPFFDGPFIHEDSHAADSFAILYCCASATVFAFMVIFPLEERLSDLKHLQMMTGLSSFVYWISSFICDLCFAVGGLFVSLSFGFMYAPYSHYSALVSAQRHKEMAIYAEIITFLLFTPCSCFMMYSISHFARNVGSGISLAMGSIMLFGIVLPFITLSLSEEANAGSATQQELFDETDDKDPTHPTYQYTLKHDQDQYHGSLWVLRLAPIFSLALGIKKMTLTLLENGKCNHFTPAGEEFYCSKSFQNISFDPCCRNCFEVGGSRRKYCYDRNQILRMPWSPPIQYNEEGEENYFGYATTTEAIKSTDYDWSRSRSLFPEWTCLIVVGILSIVAVIFVDSDTWRYIIACVNSLRGRAFQTDVEDDDVVDENERVERLIAENRIDEDALIAHKLGKTYGIFPALQDISFGVHPGECFGILGVNGAGKSSLFNLLAGIITETYGNVYSIDCTLTSHRSWYLQKIGYSPHHGRALSPFLSPRENLRLFASLRDLSREKATKQIDEAIELLSLTEHADKQVRHLSEGIRRRVSAAVSFIAKPPIILIDEPTSMADPCSRRYIWVLIKGMRKLGHTVIFSSHRITECESLCGRVAFLIDGKFQCIGSPTHLKNKFGRGYKLIIKLIQGKADNQNYVSSLSENVVTVFNPCTVRDRRRNVVQYVIHDAQVRWDFLYKNMAVIQARFNDLVEDYEFSETTLEEVFLSFVIYQHTGRIPDTSRNCC